MFVLKLGLVMMTVLRLKGINASSYPWLEQIARQEILTAGCDRLRNDKQISLELNQLDHILVDHKHKFLYCYVPKVACTNWKRVLMVLTDRSNATDLASIPATLVHADGTLTKLPELNQNEARYVLENYTSFIMVRHPFERLLSAYRNKLVGSQPSAKYFQSRIGRYIVKNYRKNPRPEELENGDDVTFKEFVSYLVTEGMNNDAVNEHWRPITQLCHPCYLNYTFVGKYEKFDEDASSILNMIDAPYVQFPQTRSSHTDRRLKLYYKALGLEDIEKLYKLYELDFKLFGYNLENILGYDIG